MTIFRWIQPETTLSASRRRSDKYLLTGRVPGGAVGRDPLGLGALERSSLWRRSRHNAGCDPDARYIRVYVLSLRALLMRGGWNEASGSESEWAMI